MVDSCVIVEMLVSLDQHRRESSVHTLRAHDKRYRVVLPALVLAEVTGSGAVRGDDGGQLARSERIALAHEWVRSSDFLIADITERVAKRAAGLATQFNLKGADACVLAVAAMWKCSTLFTWDHGLLKVGGSLDGLTVREPYVQGQVSLFGDSGVG
ncbi:PIN domain-containing protein [Allokutzneria sp. NRRL B-24872]|uniref:type II toxin-antitoxin system VapC family toxin n=1 Tax=Allokutzneria sp. NRRL B-24872 TaxID=1137961 RepID=UPI00211119FE|nr:PIN domain-containing protein [Allokutzneria sp. NRRL B-24872]